MSREADNPALKRLPSLKPPRDLTLTKQIVSGNPGVAGTPAAAMPNGPGSSSSFIGGTKPKFAPNLALAGKRQAPTPSTSSSSSAATKKVAYEKRPPKKKPVPEFVQSRGIFSEGLGDGAAVKTSGSAASILRAGSGTGGGGGSWGSSSAGKKSTESFSKLEAAGGSKLKSEPTETDDAALSMLLRGSFISDLSVGKSPPQVLPINSRVKKEEYFGKSEIGHQNGHVADADDDDSNDSQTSSAFGRESPSGKFILVQLPSVFSEILNGGSTEDQLQTTSSSIKKEIKSEPLSSPTTEAPPDLNKTQTNSKPKHVLDPTREGYCGKLQFLKSGKIRLKLGSTAAANDNEEQTFYFDVNLAKTTFAQQLVHIQCDEESGSLDVISDKVKHRMLITPDIESITRNLTR